jgi:hypothetical protein
VRAYRELDEAKISYDTVIAPKTRVIAGIKKNAMITSRKTESAQIRVNQTQTKITDLSKRINFKRMDLHLVASRNEIMNTRLKSRDSMLGSIKSAIAERSMHTSML